MNYQWKISVYARLNRIWCFRSNFMLIGGQKIGIQPLYRQGCLHPLYLFGIKSAGCILCKNNFQYSYYCPSPEIVKSALILTLRRNKKQCCSNIGQNEFFCPMFDTDLLAFSTETTSVDFTSTPDRLLARSSASCIAARAVTGTHRFRQNRRMRLISRPDLSEELNKLAITWPATFGSYVENDRFP